MNQAAVPESLPAWLAQARRQGTSREAALAVFDRLEPVPIAAMIGQWRGAGIATGHPLDGLLETFGWYGKRFEDAETVHPLLFGTEGGAIVAVNPKFLTIELATRLRLQNSRAAALAFRLARPLFTTRAPKARLRMIAHRGRTTATMIYDGQPIADSFRRIDDDTMLGVMDYRAFPAPFFFLLERC